MLNLPLRPEQQEAVNQTYSYWQKTQTNPQLPRRFLWNAKPRFGKTLAAYAFADQISAERILIITNRPSISDSWRTDYDHFLTPSLGATGNPNSPTTTPGATGNPNNPATTPSTPPFYHFANSRSDLLRSHLLSPNPTTPSCHLSAPLIFFISLQDLKGGSLNSHLLKEKNQWIFQLDRLWDLVIIDEGHEAAWTEKSLRVFSSIPAQFFLYLSGTPFRMLADQHFPIEAIYNWTYLDEQSRYPSAPRFQFHLLDHPAKESPDAPLITPPSPQTSLITSPQTPLHQNQLTPHQSQHTPHQNQPTDNSVTLLLDTLATHFQTLPPAGDDFSFRHTFWLLSGVHECHALATQLAAHHFFRDYQVILAVGKTDNYTSGKKILDQVRAAIGSNPRQTRTITLSCGQLSTGVTVPEWSAAIMLTSPSDLARISSSFYLQTAFRTQNPWPSTTLTTNPSPELSNAQPTSQLQQPAQRLSAHQPSLQPLAHHPSQPVVASELNPSLASFTKQFSYIIDFYPERALSVLRDYAENLCTSQHPEHPKHSAPSVPPTPKQEPVTSSLLFPTSTSLPTASTSPSHTSLQDLFRYLDVFYRNCQLSAAGAITLSRRLVGSEIVDGGFTASDKLFRLDKIFSMSPEAQAAINRITDYRKNRSARTPSQLTLPEPLLDSRDRIVITQSILDESYHRLLRSPRFADLSSSDRQELKNLASIELALPDTNQYNFNTTTFSPITNQKISAALTQLRELSRKTARRRYHDTTARYRDKLRGLSRTLPFLLHLYGTTPDFRRTLSSIPPADFSSLTSFTKADLMLLLDEGLFDEDNCNLALAEFLRRESASANYCKQDTPYIFDFIPTYDNACIFTPATTVKKIVDIIEFHNPQLFYAPTTRFFDPSARSGLFLAEIVRRLYRRHRPQYPSDTACLDDIFSRQIFGWTANKFLRRSVLRTLHGSTISTTDNIFTFDPTAKKGNINVQDLQQTIKATWGAKMRFDIIIGNPPFQKGRRQVYADFYKLAVDLDPQLLCMVFPQGWQKTYNHNGLGQINNAHYKRDPHLVSIDNYDAHATEELFPHLGTGGVNIVVRDRSHDNGGKIQKLENGQPAGTIVLPLTASEITKPPELLAILPQLELLPKLSALGSARKPYGFYSDPLRNPDKYQLTLHSEKQAADDVRLFGLLPDTTRGYRYISRRSLPKTTPCLDAYKLFVPKAWGNMSDSIGLGGSYANICVAGPSDACSETFIEFGPLATQAEAIKMGKYFMTQFFRALLFLAKDSQNSARDKYRFVPVPDLSLPIWQEPIPDIDEYLFEEFHLPATTRDLIRTRIQPRSEANIEIL